MNTIFELKNKMTAKYWAVLTMFSLLMSAFPASFFIAEAANVDAVGDVTVEVLAAPSVANGEYFTIAFTGAGTLNLDGWTVEDGTNVRHTFGATSLASGAMYKVCQDTGVAAGCDTQMDSGASGVWNNTGGDTLTVKDETSATVLTVTIPDPAVSDVVYTNTDAVDYAPATINITNLSELQDAIENQANGQTWIIQSGSYGLDRSSSVEASGQTGWYFPIVADDITITGVGNPVIYGAEFSQNGNFSSQNLISVFGDNVTIEGLTLMPKVSPNKTIEVLGEDFTLKSVVFEPNTMVAESLYDGIANVQDREDLKQWGGSLYFSHEGNHLIQDVTINNGGVSFRYSPSGTDIEFDNVQIVNETNVDWINGYRFSSAFNNGGNSTTGLPEVTYHVNNTLNNAASALGGAQDGDVIELDSDITTTEELQITTAVTFNGNGFTITPDFITNGGNNSVLEIFSIDGVTITDLVIDSGVGNTKKLHGFNVYESADLLLDGVTAVNNGKSGIVVNSSEVTVNNVTTGGNAWHGINVDEVTQPAELTVNGISNHTDVLHIYVDDRTEDVVVNDTNSQYDITDDVLKTNDRLYMLKPADETNPTITVKEGAITCEDGYHKVSFKLFDARLVDKIVLNGVEKDLTNNKYSDLNNVEPGKFGAVEGMNVLEVYDVAGNVTVLEFVLCDDPSKSPTATVKEGEEFTLACEEGYEMVSFKLYDAENIDRVVINGVEKDLTDNKWSDVNFIKPGVFGAVLGENTMVVYDVKGNNTTYTFFLCDEPVDTTKPSVTITYPANGAVLSDGTFTVTGTASDGESEITEVKYTVTEITEIGGVYVSSIDAGIANGTNDWSFDALDLDDGFYRLKVQAFDAEGNWRYKFHDVQVLRPTIVMCEIVSDTMTLTEENNEYSVETYDNHPSWTANVPGTMAEWVWATSEVENPDMDETYTFVETFTVENPVSALLDIAADNSYLLYVNGTLVLDRSAYSVNFQNHTVKRDVDLLPYLVSGENEFKVVVTNIGVEGASYINNPAGVLYNLRIESEEGCEITTAPEDEKEEVVDDMFTIFGHKIQVLEQEEVYYEGWTIELRDELGVLITSTTTDDEGYYYFEVEAGEYQVHEAVGAEGWSQVEVTAGGNPVNGTYCTLLVPNDGGYSCDFYNEYTETESPEEVDEPVITRSSGGSSSGTRVTQFATPAPLVLGASTDSCPFLTEYMQIGAANNSFEVTKLQLFLNIFKSVYGGVDNPVTGIFDTTTDANVKAFQEHYRSEVLDPWFNAGIVPHNRPTGFVYKTTLWKINSLVCPELVETPSLEGEDLNSNVDID